MKNEKSDTDETMTTFLFPLNNTYCNYLFKIIYKNQSQDCNGLWHYYETAEQLLEIEILPLIEGSFLIKLWYI